MYAIRSYYARSAMDRSGVTGTMSNIGIEAAGEVTMTALTGSGGVGVVRRRHPLVRPVVTAAQVAGRRCAATDVIAATIGVERRQAHRRTVTSHRTVPGEGPVDVRALRHHRCMAARAGPACTEAVVMLHARNARRHGVQTRCRHVRASVVTDLAAYVAVRTG